jgi:2'-5' RNA ligase
MKPGDRLVCVFVGKPAAGFEFKDWPLHVTIVPWFRTEVVSSELAREINEKLSDIEPFKAQANGAAKFGRNKSVRLIKQPTPFMEVEPRVRQVLKQHQAWLVDETTKKYRSYKPHVTEQKNARLNEGDSFWCDRIYIVEQKGAHKTAVAEVRFG